MAELRGTSEAVTGRWVLLACILASSMAFIDQSALNLAMPKMQAELGATGRDLLWVVNAYLIFLSALILVGGSLGDHFGRKRVFMLGIGLFTGASVLCGAAPTVELLIAGRAIKGIGGAMMVPGSLSIISAFFGDRRGQAIGTWSAFSTLTTILGPILGGFLVSLGLWRMIFFINVPLALVALYALIVHVPESRDEEAAQYPLDYWGAALATLGLAGITYGFISVSDMGLNGIVILSFILGFGSLLGFIFSQLVQPHPMMPLGLFGSRVFLGTNAMTLFLYAALAGVLFFFPLNLIQVQGYQESEAGFTLLPFVLLLVVMSRRAGSLSDRIGPRLPLTLGSILVGLGFLALSLPEVTQGRSDYFRTFFPGVVLIGLGMGLVVSPLTAAVMGAVSTKQAGIASGVNNAVARSANVLAIAILGTVALIAFQNTLEDRTASLALSADERAELSAAAENLGETQAPQGLSPETDAAVQAQIKLAFVETFRLISYLGAGLAFISAILSFFILKQKT